MSAIGQSARHKLYALACITGLFSGLAGCHSPSGMFDDSDLKAIVAAPEPASEPVAGRAGEVLIIGGATSLKTSTRAAELYNPKTATFALTGAMKTTRAGIQAVDFASGPLAHSVLVADGLSGSGTISASGTLSFKAAVQSTSEIFTQSLGSFQTTTEKSLSSFFYTMTLLQNGSVLIVGGYTGTGAISRTGYVFDPATKTFQLTGSLNAARALHTATLLPDGTVLIVGGVTDAFGDTLGTAELYDPSTNTFTNLTQSLPEGLTLAGHTATLIAGCNCANDGKVLIAGGFSGEALGRQALESAVQNLTLYDPTAKTFTSVGMTLEDRMLHSASLLPAGKVLLAGGIYGQGFAGGVTVGGVFGGVRASAEIFDPALGKVTCVGGLKNKQCVNSMSDSRAGQSATALANGDILIAGGVGAAGTTTGGGGHALATAELFIPTRGIFRAVGPMHSTHAFHAAALLQ